MEHSTNVAGEVRGLGRAVAQSPTQGRINATAHGQNKGSKSEATGAPRGAFVHGSRSSLFAFLLLGALSAAAPLLAAEGPSFIGAMDISLRQSAGPGNGQQALSPQPAQSGDSGSGNSRRPAGPEPANKGRGTRDKPSRPNAGPDRPSGQVGRSDAKPPRPNHGITHPPGYGHPPVYPSPRPPVHHYPHYGSGHPSYQWGGGNGWRLHQFFFGDMNRINRWHRPPFFVGGYFPRIYLERIQPIPPSLMVHLPPVPLGYEVGYYDGYGLLYDPDTLEIVSVIDPYRY